MTSDHSKHLDHIPQPPKCAERLLAFVLFQEDQEVVLGDFEEAYFVIACKFGIKQARKWYWIELLQSIPSLVFLACKKSTRSNAMSRKNQLALLGAALVLPAFLLVLGGVAQSGFGTTKINHVLNFNLIFFHPAFLMGGLILAAIVNTIPIVNITFHRQDNTFVSTIQVERKLLNLSVVAFTGFLLTIILLYLLAEEFHIFQTSVS